MFVENDILDYDVYDDYLKIITPIENCGLESEQIAKLHKLGVKRVGDIISCSDAAIEAFGEKSEVVRKIKDYLELELGELDIWGLLDNIDSLEENEDVYIDLSAIDEDDPLDIQLNIVHMILYSYLKENLKLVKNGVNNSGLSIEIKEKLDFSKDALISFFVLSMSELMSNSIWSCDEVNDIREYLINILGMHKDMFNILDELETRIALR